MDQGICLQIYWKTDLKFINAKNCTEIDHKKQIQLLIILITPENTSITKFEDFIFRPKKMTVSSERVCEIEQLLDQCSLSPQTTKSAQSEVFRWQPNFVSKCVRQSQLKSTFYRTNPCSTWQDEA